MQLTHPSKQAFWPRLLANLSHSVLCVTFLAIIFSDAKADETKIAALSLAPIPEATTIEIQVPVEEGSTDIRLIVYLVDHFSKLLKEWGYTVVFGNSELIFRFSAEEPTYAQWENRTRHTRQAIGTKRNAGYLAEIFPVTLINNGILAESDRDTYRLRVSVARARKPPLWTAYIERSGRVAERPEIYLDMADAVMALWGQTYSN